MNFSTHVDTDRAVLTGAVLLYGKPQGMHARERQPIAHATIHQIVGADNQPEIQEGRPMTETDYVELVQALSPKDRPELKWQDESILASGMGKIVWWTPPMKRAMFFRESSMFAKTFSGQAMCPVPAMVWLGTKTGLYVYAIRGASRPTQETKLYQAPLFNVWARGLVCQGSAQLPAPEMRNVPKEWEKTLFGSRFTHPNFTQKNRLIEGVDPVKFWKEMIEAPAEVFPEERLVGVSLKVGNLLETDFESKAKKIVAKGEF